jgi:hypothetical protein
MLEISVGDPDLEPDPALDPDLHFFHKGDERTEIMLTKLKFKNKI